MENNQKKLRKTVRTNVTTKKEKIYEDIWNRKYQRHKNLKTTKDIHIKDKPEPNDGKEKDNEITGRQ